MKTPQNIINKFNIKKDRGKRGSRNDEVEGVTSNEYYTYREKMPGASVEDILFEVKRERRKWKPWDFEGKV